MSLAEWAFTEQMICATALKNRGTMLRGVFPAQRLSVVTVTKQTVNLHLFLSAKTLPEVVGAHQDGGCLDFCIFASRRNELVVSDRLFRILLDQTVYCETVCIECMFVVIRVVILFETCLVSC